MKSIIANMYYVNIHLFSKILKTTFQRKNTSLKYSSETPSVEYIIDIIYVGYYIKIQRYYKLWSWWSGKSPSICIS